MGVFGTLRKGGGNTYRMGNNYYSHRLAFLPNFYAEGLGIRHAVGAAAPFEIFFYEPDPWNQMIPGVDALEGFRWKSYGDYGYHRSLAKLRLLPDDFKHETFYYLNYGYRSLDIPSNEWANYPVVYSWIYSSRRQNAAAVANDENPIAWDGDSLYCKNLDDQEVVNEVSSC